MTSGIYAITHCDSGKFYIGSTVHIKKRWAFHRKQLRDGAHHSPKLQHAWNKYGAGAFEFSVLILCDRTQLLSYEQIALDEFSPAYNICKVAGSPLGTKRTAEQKALMSKQRAGRPHHAEWNANISSSLKGKTKSPQHRVSMSKAQTGKKHSPARIAAMISATTGLKRSAYARANMSMARKGKPVAPFTLSHRENLARGQRARKTRSRHDNYNITHAGETLCITDWSRRLGLSRQALRFRLERGWNIADALTVPVRKQIVRRGSAVAFNGEIKSVALWAKQFGVPKGTLHKRLDYGWTMERALTEPVRARKRSAEKIN